MKGTPLEFFASPDRFDPKFKSFLDDASRDLCDWFATTHERGPIPDVLASLDVGLKKEGLSYKDLLSDVQLLMEGSYQPSHPGALAHLDPPPLTASIVGELISAGLNNNLLAEELSPSITKLERILCKWFADKLGMPDTAGGTAVSGGSLANLMALLVARSQAKLSYDSDAVVFASADAHVSISRAIAVMGLSPQALVLIPTDSTGLLNVDMLRQQLSLLRSKGKKCFAVVATAGTTIRGSVDPLTQISILCQEEGIWLHVDAAIGGVFSLSPGYSKLLLGISNADSITINPQKVLGITKTSSLLLVADSSSLYSSFSTGFPYIEPSQGRQFQGGEIGLQGSRPSEVVKLWLGLRQLGEDGIELLLTQAVSRRQSFQELLDPAKFRILSGPLHLIAISPLDADLQQSADWTNSLKDQLLKKNFMLSRPFYQNNFYLKAVMGNPHTKISHIKQLADILNQSL